jgi:hypothetical protein
MRLVDHPEVPVAQIGRLRTPQKQGSALVQGVVEDVENRFLQLASEVDEQIPTGDEIEL